MTSLRYGLLYFLIIFGAGFLLAPPGIREGSANPNIAVRRERRHSSVGEIPTRQVSFQPVAIGTVMEVTK